MYRFVLRPLFFLLPAETVHHLVAGLLLFFFTIPGMARLFRRHYQVNDKSLEREVFGIRFPNPVGIAAGFDKKAQLYNALSNFGFGHVEIGTVTPKGQTGNPKPRLFRLKKDQALINRMGFNNEGVEAFAKRLRKSKPNIIIGGNIGKNTATPNEQATEDYCRCFEVLFELVDYFVVNVSCPNIKDLNKLQDKDNMLELLQAIQKVNQAKAKPKPVLLKISPDLSEPQLDEVLEIVRETLLDGIIATNTTLSRDNLSYSRKAIENYGHGGLSGKPLRERSTQVISYLHKRAGGNIPIIGVGGVFSPVDALEKIKAGATLVQVYTGFIYTGPSIAKKINLELLNKQQ